MSLAELKLTSIWFPWIGFWVGFWDDLCDSLPMQDLRVPALLESGVLQKHLLPRLGLVEHLCLDLLSTGFKNLLCSDADWQTVLARILPATHPLARPALPFKQTAYEYAVSTSAIQVRDVAVR